MLAAIKGIARLEQISCMHLAFLVDARTEYSSLIVTRFHLVPLLSNTTPTGIVGTFTKSMYSCNSAKHLMKS